MRTIPKVAWVLLSVAALLASAAVTVQGQSPLDGCDPNANGPIRAIVVQPDGKILIGGDFTALAPNGGSSTTRNRIARLNLDGTLDTAFDPNANQSVYSIVLQPDGKILAAGDFSVIGGQTRGHIARLDPVTGLPDSFNPDANLDIYSMALQTDGKILVGGLFTFIGGQTRNHMARVDSVTGLADSFDPNSNSLVFSIVVQPDGNILTGGTFSGANSIGGQTRNRIARLNPTTGLADSFNPNANQTVFTIALQPDGKILAGGDFNGANSIGGQTRNRIARLDPTTGLADSFNPNANVTINVIVLQPDGSILTGGGFTTIGGQTRNNIARLNPNTGLADSFAPNPVASVRAIAVQPDSKIYIGGDFNTIAPNGGPSITRNHIARLEVDGRADQTINLNLVGSQVEAVALQADGKILIGGTFTSVLGVTRNNLARLNTDGTVDLVFDPDPNGNVKCIVVQENGSILVGGNFTFIGTQTRNRIARLGAPTGLADSFNPNASDIVYAIAVQADGKVLAAGNFIGANSIGGQTRNHIARLDGATGTADSFNPNPNGFVGTMAIQTDSKILAGGQFSSIGGQTRNRIARLDPTTGLADSFDPNAIGDVEAIVVQPDGNILTGGNFNTIGGQTRNHIARLDATTGLADSFDPNANLEVLSIAVQADTKIVVGGPFTSIGGQTRNRIARLDASTGSADSFNPNANSSVSALSIQSDGKILAGGVFTTLGGQSRSRFARLTNDTSALQDLVVFEHAITWIRGGSSPQFSRVLFAYSPDGVGYLGIGVATPSGSNWTATGINLPVGQNFFVRARGHSRSGFQNGSEGITESIRNAFIAATPSPSPTPTPTPTPLPDISGNIIYCNAIPIPTVNGVLMTLTGTSSGSTTTSGSGNYSFSGLAFGGSYTVTPTKADRAPGSQGINTLDVVAVQKHFLGSALLTGCRLTAANVVPPAAINTLDILAIQHFFLGQTTGIGNVGKFQFNPVSRTYAPLGSSQIGQNFDALIFGDVALPYINPPRPGGPSPDTADDDSSVSASRAQPKSR